MATILVVDDAEFLRLRISKMLITHGHQVVQAENGVSALEIYRTTRPEAVLMDVTMPEMDGLTALREIRTLDPQARVVMLTALGQDAVVMEALRAGAFDFVVKPFDAGRVIEIINKAIASRVNIPA